MELGFIGASSKTGCSNSEDYLNRLIVGFVQLKKFPNDVETISNVIPVDFVAKSIVALSHEDQFYRRAFHLVNPNGFLSMKTLVDGIRSLGCEMQGVPYIEWKKELYKIAGETSGMGKKGET